MIEGCAGFDNPPICSKTCTRAPVKFQSEAIVITLGALLQSPEEPQSAAAVPSPFISSDEDAAQLLELRTETGPIYVRPSR